MADAIRSRILATYVSHRGNVVNSMIVGRSQAAGILKGLQRETTLPAVHALVSLEALLANCCADKSQLLGLVVLVGAFTMHFQHVCHLLEFAPPTRQQTVEDDIAAVALVVANAEILSAQYDESDKHGVRQSKILSRHLRGLSLALGDAAAKLGAKVALGDLDPIIYVEQTHSPWYFSESDIDILGCAGEEALQDAPSASKGTQRKPQQTPRKKLSTLFLGNLLPAQLLGQSVAVHDVSAGRFWPRASSLTRRAGEAPEPSKDPSIVASMREAVARLVPLMHPNLVSVLGLSSSLYVVYTNDPLVRVSLYQVMVTSGLDVARQGPAGNLQQLLIDSPRRRVRIVKDILCALEYLHAHAKPLPLLACDLSPHTVVLSPDGRARISTFGLAQLKRRASMVESLDASLATCLAPELRDSDESTFTTHTDMFSAGTIAYYLAIGPRLPVPFPPVVSSTLHSTTTSAATAAAAAAAATTKTTPTTTTKTTPTTTTKTTPTTAAAAVASHTTKSTPVTPSPSDARTEDPLATLLIDLGLFCRAPVPHHRPTPSASLYYIASGHIPFYAQQSPH